MTRVCLIVCLFWSSAASASPVTDIFCGALKPIAAGFITWKTKGRELTSREVHVMLAGCFAGPLGEWLMNRWFDRLGPLRIYKPKKNEASVGWKVLGVDPDPFIRLQLHRTWRDGLYE